MSYQTRTYDLSDGHPAVVLVATGTFDVSRLMGLLASGRCEEVSLAQQLRRQVNRHNGGRAALKLLADHGGPDLLERVKTSSSTEDVPDAPGTMIFTAGDIGVGGGIEIAVHENGALRVVSGNEDAGSYVDLTDEQEAELLDVLLRRAKTAGAR